MRRALFVLFALFPVLATAQTLAQQVLELVNTERWDNGQRPPLKGQANLDTAAFGHSQAMGQRNFFMHCDPDTLTSPGARMTTAGYNWNIAGENIAAGYISAAAVMQGWMNSSGHAANILSTSYREIGIGYYLDGGDTANVRRDTNGDCTPENSNGGPYAHYWTQNFGSRDAVMPVVIAREAWQVSQCNIDIYLYGTGWAVDYRLSNDGVNWSPWQPFSANVLWNLSGPAGGTATVYAQIRNAQQQVRSAQDSVRLAVACNLSDLIFEHDFEPGS